MDVWLTYLTPWRAAERGAGNKPLDPAVRAKRQGQTRLLKDGVATFRDSMQLVTGIVQSGGMGGGGGSGGSGGGGGRGSDDGLGGRRGGGSSGSGRHGRRQRKIQPRAGDFANKFYKKYNTHWEPYVVHNYAVRARVCVCLCVCARLCVSELGRFARGALGVCGQGVQSRLLGRLLTVSRPKRLTSTFVPVPGMRVLCAWGRGACVRVPVPCFSFTFRCWANSCAKPASSTLCLGESVRTCACWRCVVVCVCHVITRVAASTVPNVCLVERWQSLTACPWSACVCRARNTQRVLLVFEPCVVETLTRCSKVIERVIGQTNTGSRFHTPARLAGSEWIFNALQQHMRVRRAALWVFWLASACACV